MTTGSADDQRLFDAWRLGDARAGDMLVARHAPAVRRYLSRAMGASVDDAFQEVWKALSSCRERFEQRSTFRTFLFAIARNQAREELRRRRRAAQHEALEDEREKDSCPGAEAVMEEMEEARRLAAALAELPMELQRLVALYYFERRTAKEIGEMFGIPENTARSRLRRAKALLRAAMEAGGSAGVDLDDCLAVLQGGAHLKD